MARTKDKRRNLRDETRSLGRDQIREDFEDY